MDKRSLILGIGCIGIAFGLMVRQSSLMREEYLQQQSSQKAITSDSQVSSSSHGVTLSADEESLGVELKKQPTLDAECDPSVFEKSEIVSLENEQFSVKLSNIGGGIQEVILKKHKAERDSDIPFIVNQGQKSPMLLLAFGKADKKSYSRYVIKERTANRVTFGKKMKNGILLERTYELKPNVEGYIIAHRVQFSNTTSKDFDLGDIFVDLGSYPSTSSDRYGEFLNFGYFDGKKAHFIKNNDFKASNGFLGLGKKAAKNEISGDDKIVWGAVKNQFFTSVYTPQSYGTGFVAHPVTFKSEKNHELQESVCGSIRFSVGHLHAGEKKIFEGELYVGPKDYVLLDKLGHEQDRVMQFGWFGFVSKFLLLMMRGIHSLIPSWGMTIIILTLIVKLVLWPLTTAQVRSSRKMAKIQEPLKKIKERYGDNPQKLQAETLKLFRDHKVNPAAGCLPVFVQIPIFLGLYVMLRTTADMRFMPFLWIKDLSLPDTIGSLGGFSINLLPLIMGLTMALQMHVTPTPSIDGAQKWVFKTMPFIFLFICYNLPSALVLYWTIQNLLTIAQQIILNRKNDEELLIEDVEPKKKSRRK